MADAKNKENDQLFQMIVENLSDVVWIMDMNFHNTYVSPSIYQQRGYRPEEVKDQPLSDRITPDSLEKVTGLLAEAMKRIESNDPGGWEPVEFEIEQPCKNGSIIWTRNTVRLLPGKDGRPSGILGVSRDITDRKKAQQALKDSEERLQSIFRAAPTGIGVVTDRILTQVNERICEMTGYSQNDLLGRSARILYPTDRDFIYVGEEKYRQISLYGTGTVETHWKRKDGSIIDVLLSSTPIDFEDFKKGVTFTALDITQRNRAEAERKKLESQLIQAQKMEAVGRLAGGVAHDFNNMLSVIIGHSNMALEQMDPSRPLYADLEEIRKAGERSADLTRQLLMFARKQTVSPKILDLNRTVAGMISLLKRLIGEDIALEWLPGDPIWPVRIDPGQVDQILANLCVNARDAIDDVGKITIQTDTSTFDEEHSIDHPGCLPGDHVVLIVSDDGCGIDPETMDKIFEPFFTTKEPGKGTGLGLATVYGVVKQNHGFIDIVSRPGLGSTFRIYLPRYRNRADATPEKKQTQTTEFGKETILLVEDEPAILRMTKIMLQRLGYHVLTAGTPGEAVRIAREYTGALDLLVTDVIMPEMNGRDLARQILSFHPALKRLFMSGYTADVIAHHGVLDEGVNFIQKPFSKESLGVKIREILIGKGD